jgi:hypothetical protein
MKKIISGREFIKMMRPMLGVTQGSIVSMTVTARVNDVAIIEIECLAKLNDCEVNIVDVAATEYKPEKRRFIVEVTEEFDTATT